MKIVAARNDDEGRIAAVRFEGNSTFTPLATAVRIAEREGIQDHHIVRSPHARTHLRSNPDGRSANNLDELAKR